MEDVKSVTHFLLFMPTHMDFTYLVGYQISKVENYFCLLTKQKHQQTHQDNLTFANGMSLRTSEFKTTWFKQCPHI